MDATKTRIAQLPAGVRFAAGQLLHLGTGLLLAKTRLFGALPSFAVAFAAASDRRFALSACIGAAAGSVLFAPDLLTGLTGAAAAAACGMICFVLRVIGDARETPATASLVAFLCCFAADGTTLLAGGLYLSGVLVCVCDSVLAGGAAYFYMRARMLRALVQRPAALDGTEALCITVCACALLLPLSSWTIYVFVPARAAAVLLILLSCRLFGMTGAGAAGVLCGAAMEIACASPGLACCYALGGLLGGLFSRRLRWAPPVCMTAIVGLYPLLAQTNDAVAVFAETALACGAFCAIPRSAMAALRRMVGAASVSGDDDAAVLRGKLHTAARAVSAITPYLAEQQLRQGKVPGSARMTQRVRELACTDCAQQSVCWQTREAETSDALRQCFSDLHRRQHLSPEELPAPLDQVCVRRNMLCAACLQAYAQTTQTPYASEGIPEWITADPFAAASDLLSDAAEQLDVDRRELPRESGAAGQVLRHFGVVVRDVQCSRQSGRLVLTARTDPPAQNVRRAALTASLGKACGCAFSLPSVRVDGDLFCWQFVQTAKLRLRTGTAQCPADGRVCGDFFMTFAKGGKQIFLLCDGMGTGAQAAADAEATAEIFASLVGAELSFDCALRTVNEAMLLREDAESVCALDAVCVDLYTGETVFCKAGAAASYVLHRGKPDRIETPCMPVGILPDTTFRRTRRTLRKGDAFVLVSDGACILRDDHILFALSAFRGGSAQKLAEEILSRSRKAAPPGRQDDSTVLAVVVEEI